MKKIILIIMLSFVFSSKSIAEFDMYMVEEKESTIEIDSFYYDQTPWAYISMPREEGCYKLKVSWWAVVDPTLKIKSCEQDLWVSLAGGWGLDDEWETWEEIKLPDSFWNVEAKYKYIGSSGPYIKERIIFYVEEENSPIPMVPGPLPIVLFIVGGITLIVRKLFIRKR